MTSLTSPKDLDQAQDLLHQLTIEVQASESTLSGGTKLGLGGTALQALNETRLRLGNPTDNLIKLTPRLFDEVGFELTELRKQQMKEQFDYYYLTLSASLQPARGAHFARLECLLNLGPKGQHEPIVQAMFPTAEWKEVLRWGGAMSLGINSDLHLSVATKTTDTNRDATEAKQPPAKVQASLAHSTKLKSFILVPDYSFSIGRSDIIASGEGSSDCFWRIETPELQQLQTVRFGLIFKVPQGTKNVDLTALIAAAPSFNWLVANLRNVFDRLSETLKQFLRKPDNERTGRDSLPLGDHETWSISLHP